MSAARDDTYGRPRRRRMEIFAFLFLTAVLMPALAIATVGSYGLAVWVYQMVAGPPGPPRRDEPTGIIIVAKAQSALDRRAVITGRLLNPDRVVAPPGAEIASIWCRPGRNASMRSRPRSSHSPGCEIYGRDPKGKLVVVVDAPDAGALGTTLNNIALLPDVYSASLVFHAIDASMIRKAPGFRTRYAKAKLL